MITLMRVFIPWTRDSMTILSRQYLEFGAFHLSGKVSLEFVCFYWIPCPFTRNENKNLRKKDADDK